MKGPALFLFLAVFWFAKAMQAYKQSGAELTVKGKSKKRAWGHLCLFCSLYIGWMGMYNPEIFK